MKVHFERKPTSNKNVIAHCDIVQISGLILIRITIGWAKVDLLLLFYLIRCRKKWLTFWCGRIELDAQNSTTWLAGINKVWPLTLNNNWSIREDQSIRQFVQILLLPDVLKSLVKLSSRSRLEYVNFFKWLAFSEAVVFFLTHHFFSSEEKLPFSCYFFLGTLFLI